MALVEPEQNHLLGDLSDLGNSESEFFTEEEFLENTRIKNKSTAQGYDAMLSNVRLFCLDSKTDFETILSSLKEQSDKGNKMATIKFIQRWINWMAEEHPHLRMRSNSFGHRRNFVPKDNPALKGYAFKIRVYFEMVVGILVTSKILKKRIKYPETKERESPIPLEREQLRNILENIHDAKRQVLYRVIKDTACRISAGVQLRKKHFDMTKNPPEVTFPAHIMKKDTNGQSIEVTKYIIKEDEEILSNLLDSYDNPEDLVFATNENPDQAINNEESFFRRLVKNLGYTRRYKHSDRLVVNIHSIKAFT